MHRGVGSAREKAVPRHIACSMFMEADEASVGVHVDAEEEHVVHKGHLTLDALVQALRSCADIGSTDASATQRCCYKVTSGTANCVRSDQPSGKARRTALSCNSSTAVVTGALSGC